jgi:hypothetical protein
VIIGEIGLEKGNFYSYSKCHVPLRAEDGIIVGKMLKMLELIPSRSMISTRESPPRLRFVGCSTAAGLGRMWGGSWRGSSWRGPLSPLLSTGSRPAAAWSGGRLGAPSRCALTTSVPCWQPSGCWLWPLRGDTIHSTLTGPQWMCTTSHPLNYSHSYIATPHAPTYSLTQVPGWNWNPILTRPHPRSRWPSYTTHHTPPSHLNTHPFFTPPSISNGDLSPL